MADEVEFAGGKNQGNNQYYLYNGQNYWTMSPNNWDDSCACMFRVYETGYINNNSVNGTADLRPIINLKADIRISDGIGTLIIII